MTSGLLTKRWSDRISLSLGVVIAIYIIIVLTSAILEDKAAFIGLIVIGGIT